MNQSNTQSSTDEPTPGSTQQRWALLLTGAVILAVMIGAGVLALGDGREKARRINCYSHLNGLGLALRMYSSDHDEHFPDELSLWFVCNYHPTMICYTCPSTDTEPAPRPEAFRSDQHLDYIYFGKGLTEDCRGCDPAKTILACDKPGNHRGFFNILCAAAPTKGYQGDSIQEIADKNGLFLPGYNMPEKAPDDKATKPE